MNILEKLAKLADYLDDNGLYDAADEVDVILSDIIGHEEDEGEEADDRQGGNTGKHIPLDPKKLKTKQPGPVKLPEKKDVKLP